ncbi:hypothetical protein [Brevibacillus laterosporus]|uniref:hypothetical protein n=1 Tax=Brevibacillus laterosporus TaxID=1465 RepID=UPI0013156AA3|nr:hypothetical protein [Brevibacillus laterosporus]
MIESGSSTDKVTAYLQADTEFYDTVRVWDQYNNASLVIDNTLKHIKLQQLLHYYL